MTGNEAIERALLSHRKLAREAGQEAERSYRGVEGAAKRRGSAEDRAFREAEQAAARYQRQFEAEAKAQEKAAARVATAKEREAKRAAAAQEREGKASAKAAERAAKQRENAERVVRERSEREERKTEEKKARARQSALEYVARIRDRHLDDEQRKRDSVASKAAQEEERSRKRVRDRAGRALGSIASGAKSGILTGVATGGALATGIVGAATKDEFQLQRTASRISINARQAGQAFIDPTMLRKEFEATALANPGTKALDVAAGTQRFITDTGDIQKAREFSSTFTQTAMASDSDLEAIAATGADLFQKFGIKTKEGMQEALASIYFGGKSGAFELKNFSEKMAPIASAGRRFGVDSGVEGVKTMAGITQIAMGATKNADKAATAVEATLRQLISRSGDLKSDYGVKVFDEKTNKTRNVKDVLVETIAKVGGLSAEKKSVGLQKIMGDEGIVGISPLITTFNDSAREAKAKGLDPMVEGMRAVRAELDKAINAPGDWSELMKDNAQAQRDSGAQITAAFERIKAVAGERLVPTLETLLPKLADSADVLDPFIEAVGLAGDALVDMVDWLRGAGFLYDSKSHGERAADAEKSLIRLNEKGNEQPLDAKQLAERDELKRKFITESSDAAVNQFDSKKKMTEAEFGERYYAMGNPGETTRAKSLSLAASLARDPGDAIASSDLLFRVSNLLNAIPALGASGGENEAQRDLRHQFTAQGKSDPSSTGAGEVANLNGELVALTGAARAATRALAAVEAANRPSILAGQ